MSIVLEKWGQIAFTFFGVKKHGKFPHFFCLIVPAVLKVLVLHWGMLTDSRESRWLPSLLVAAAQEIGGFHGMEFLVSFLLKLFRFCVGAPLLTGQRESTLGPHSSLGLWLFLGFQAFLAHGMAAWISDFRCVTTLFDPKCRQTYRNSPAACYFCNDVTAPSDLWQPINQIPYLCCVNGTQICR